MIPSAFSKLTSICCPKGKLGNVITKAPMTFVFSFEESECRKSISLVNLFLQYTVMFSYRYTGNGAYFLMR